MPISFLEQNQAIEPRLKARMFVREFASHRYGIFKESGFRYDYMYPPFASLPGLPTAVAGISTVFQRNNRNKTNPLNQQGQLALIGEQANYYQQQHNVSAGGQQTNSNNNDQLQASIRGFDEFWNECSFETSPASGLPTSNSINCSPYLTKQATETGSSGSGNKQQQSGLSTGPSFNLMSTDPFSYADLSSREAQARLTNQPLPVEWRDLSGGTSSASVGSSSSESVKWHFCGENFPLLDPSMMTSSMLTHEQQFNNRLQKGQNLAHNQLATNKQNVMCNERSALDVIKSSEDFRRTPFR